MTTPGNFIPDFIPDVFEALTQPEPPLLVDVSNAPETDALVNLYAMYPDAKAAADDAAARLKAVTDAIKVELTTRAPEGTARLELRGQGGTPLRLNWQVTNRFDTTRFKAEQGALYDAYKKPSGSWVLSAIRGA